MSDAPPATEAEIENRMRLVALWTEHQRKVFAYIRAFVPSSHDADDILQETGMVVCRKFDEFKPDTNFLSWSCQIAFWEIKNAQQKFARSKVVFDAELMETVAPQFAELACDVDRRHEALSHCLKKLQPRDREFMLVRYEHGKGVDEAAKRSGRTVETAYRALNRLRKLLFDCVNHQLGTESNQ